MREAVLKAEHLVKRFQKGKEAINDVSFVLAKGEILGLAGESGSGKSTIGRMVSGLTIPDEGRVYLDGREITALKGKQKRQAFRHVQMVFQDPIRSFDPLKTLGQSIGESLINQKMPKETVQKKTAELLNQCGLSEEYARKYPDEVSGGEGQRAAIARALASDPDILIGDEAVSSLDVHASRQIVQLLKKLQKEKELSILFISHDMALMQEICGRVIVLHAGKIVEEGRMDQVINSPVSIYTKELIEASI